MTAIAKAKPVYAPGDSLGPVLAAAAGRLARTGRRVALRQLVHTAPVTERLCDWRRAVEGVRGRSTRGHREPR